MPTDWIRERAYAIAAHAIGDNGHARTLAARIAALVVEAIDRTRSEERALQTKLWKAAASSLREIEAQATNRGQQSILARLRNPDEALVEAFQDASDEYYNADHDVTLEGWFTHICRALAATLDEKEG